MSLAELLPAIQALMPEERQELKRILDSDSGQKITNPVFDLPEETRKLLPPTGTTIDVFIPELSVEDYAKALEFCEAMKGKA